MKKLILLFLIPLVVFAAPTQPITNGVVPSGGTLAIQAGGALTAASAITSTVSTGTAPFVVASTTLVSNLHAATADLASTVTTNANLTGAVTSTGNATSLGSFSSANLSSALTDETGTGVAVFGTSPAITTSITTPSTTFSLYNTTATTINAFGGASTALNMGNASGATSMLGIIGFDGATPSSTTAAIFPASTTGVSSARFPHGSAPTSPVNGDFWSTTSGFFGRVNGSTVGPFSTGGSGTVTVVSSGSLTSTALVTGGGTTTLQTPSATATLDSSGNISTPGTIATGIGGSVAGATMMGQGTAVTAATSSVGWQAPASVTTKYNATMPTAPSTGALIWTGASDPTVMSVVAPGTSGNVLTSNGTTWVSSAAAGGTPANPTGTVGLTAVNGSASTYMRSDGAPPLSQSITPTWTNLHTFSAGITSTAGTNSIAPLVDSVDGTTPLNNIVEATLTGTAYTMTTSFASITGGTTSPSITIPNAGTYMIYAEVQTSLVSATTTTQNAQIKLRRTNNTAADVGSTFSQPLPVSTITSEGGPSISIVATKYTTTNTNDVLVIQGQLSASLGAGTVTVTDARIIASRAY